MVCCLRHQAITQTNADHHELTTHDINAMEINSSQRLIQQYSKK